MIFFMKLIILLKKKNSNSNESSEDASVTSHHFAPGVQESDQTSAALACPDEQNKAKTF
jgi:hypothetical protein